MGLYDKQNGRVGRAQGASVLFIGDTGFFDLGDVVGGANGTQYTGKYLQLYLASQTVRCTYVAASGAVNDMGLSASYAYGTIGVKYSGISVQSVILPGAVAGAELALIFRCGTSDILLKASGASVVGVLGSDLSSIKIVNGSANMTGLTLMAGTDNVWSVTFMGGSAGGVVEQPSS